MSPIAQQAEMTIPGYDSSVDLSPIDDITSCFDDFSADVCFETEGEICFGCGGLITDRYLLKVNERAWHAECLRCCVCHVNLDRQTSCFTKEDNIYCKIDYTREFGTKCAKCLRHIQATDWVRRAKDSVYHLACFACDSCKRQLSTGEEFALQNDRVLCKAHYIEIIEGGPHSDEAGSQKQKTKRVRTTFTEEQVQVLQANFALDSNPDGQDLERIAQITGLSKRVTQVWFQNSRARQKKHQQNKMNSTSPGGASIALTSVTCSMSPSPGACSQRTVSPPMGGSLVSANQGEGVAISNHINNAISESMAMMAPLNLNLPCSASVGMTMSNADVIDSWHNQMTPCSEPSMTYVS